MAEKSKPRLAAVCLSVFALLAMTGGAFAQNETCFRLPPQKYRHEPTQAYTMHYVKPDDLRKHCNGGLWAYMPTPGACTLMDTREVFIPDNLKGAMLSCTVQHEKAHLNGWPANHPIR